MIEEIIKQIATAASHVADKYLNLTTTYEPSGIVRERVFCYELYHQLRLHVDDYQQLTLNGEIDKRGHPDFREVDRKNPDFVFHIPGQHEGNTIVCEVKGNLDISGIVKDLETITTFVSLYNYKAGVFLLYNHTLSELVDRYRNNIGVFINSQYADRIFIITLPVSGKIETVNRLNEL